jgi:hypothetical protein
VGSHPAKKTDRRPVRRKAISYAGFSSACRPTLVHVGTLFGAGPRGIQSLLTRTPGARSLAVQNGDLSTNVSRC